MSYMPASQPAAEPEVWGWWWIHSQQSRVSQTCPRDQSSSFASSIHSNQLWSTLHCQEEHSWHFLKNLWKELNLNGKVPNSRTVVLVDMLFDCVVDNNWWWCCCIVEQHQWQQQWWRSEEGGVWFHWREWHPTLWSPSHNTSSHTHDHQPSQQIKIEQR